MGVSLSMYAGAGAQFFDNNGDPLSGGKIYTYVAGTTTPATTYTSSTGGTANANPIVLDSAGRTPAQIWLTEGSSYKFVLQTSTDTLIKTDDNIFASYQLAVKVGVAVGNGNNSISSNIAVGNTALASISSGGNNTAVGYNTAYSLTSSSYNTAIGASALYSGSAAGYSTALGSLSMYGGNGSYGTAVGYRAMYSDAGTYNVAIGYDALFTNAGGADNTAIGAQTLNIYTGSNATAIGRSALSANTTGSNNTALGYQAGDAVSTGAQNVLVGASAGSSGTNDLTTGSNNILIGYNAAASSATVSNEITLGNASITSMRVPGLTLTFSAKYFNNGTLTVATLPAAATAGAGARAFVTDANATTFASVVAGGGANGVPVYSDGTNWRIG